MESANRRRGSLLVVSGLPLLYFSSGSTVRKEHLTFPLRFSNTLRSMWESGMEREEGSRLATCPYPVLLSYEVGASGWTDELTEVHEEEAGEATT